MTLLVHLFVHGPSWGVGYWLIVTALGLWLDASNLRHAWRQVRSVRPGELDERPMRASTLAHVVTHLALTLFLALALLTGLGLVAGSLTAGLQLQFTSRAGEVAVIGLALSVPTVPTVIAALFWLWRWRTVRALG
jgi:hypothetical protein